jgi:hypothetical protein
MSPFAYRRVYVSNFLDSGTDLISQIFNLNYIMNSIPAPAIKVSIGRGEIVFRTTAYTTRSRGHPVVTRVIGPT